MEMLLIVFLERVVTMDQGFKRKPNLSFYTTVFLGESIKKLIMFYLSASATEGG